MKHSYSLAAILFLLSASLSANPILTSVDGIRRITVNANQVFYESGNGAITIEMSGAGMKIGQFELRAEEMPSRLGGRRFHLVVMNGPVTKTAEIEIAADNSTIDSTNIDDFTATVRAFHSSAEGQLLQEARTLIEAQRPIDKKRIAFAESDTRPEAVIRGKAVQDRNDHRLGVQPLDFWSWSCAGNILNGIAAGAAVVGGCGTPSCGPAIAYCCGGSVSWYLSSLIGIAQNC